VGGQSAGQFGIRFCVPHADGDSAGSEWPADCQVDCQPLELATFSLDCHGRVQAAVGPGRQRLRHPGPHRRTAAALRAAGVPQEEVDAFFAEATSGDYDHLLQTTMAWVDWE
jgi:hypothetical protein